MQEPLIFGIPLTALFLYFIIYAFLGWVIETAYCSIIEKRFAVRGFLLGPICPIYGIGVLIMILFFAPLADRPPLFFLVSTITMSAWEYFVGWLLETTTHIKYWDYSDKKFNLKGRICLQVCLCWGGLSYLAVFFLHPFAAGMVAVIPVWIAHCLSGGAFALLAADATVTIRNLALTAKIMSRMHAMSEQLLVQAALGKAELEDRLESAIDTLPVGLRNRIDDLREAIPDSPAETAALLREKYGDLLAAAERSSRRFRGRYRNMSSARYAPSLTDIHQSGAALLEKLQQSRAEARLEKARRKGRKAKTGSPKP